MLKTTSRSLVLDVNFIVAKKFAIAMATSVNPIIPNKQPLKSLNRSPKFLRNGYNMKGNAAKRKSAVELLQESKAYYVKSEQVLDSKQELKHTEHLQVTSNPSYETLLRHPHRGVATYGWDVPSSSSTVHPTRQSDQRFVAGATASLGIEPKLLTVTLCSSSPRLQVHRTTPTGGGSFRLSGKVTAKSVVISTAPAFSSSSLAGRFTSWATSSTLTTQAPGGPQQQAPPSASQVTVSGPTISKSGLPPKSPRIPHLRSKTQPEMPCPPVRPLEYRRSHSEKDNSDDIQMKLRRLLNTDSKENLNTNLQLEVVNDNDGDRDSNTVYPLGLASRVPDSMRKDHDSCNNPEPFIKPRHQQESIYSIHKSMPDLSPLQLGVVRRLSADNSEESLPFQTPKSIETKAPSWTTSDYVSRSPSSRKECLSERQEDLGSGGGGSGQTSRMEEDDNDSFCALDIMPRRHYEPEGLVAGIRRRPILRSKSDISHRYSKSGTDLSQAGSPKRNSRTGAELERFFDTMGLDSSILYVLKTPPSDSSEPVFFNSVSTGSSSCIIAGGGGDVNPPESDVADEESNANAISGAASAAASMPLKDGITNKDLLQHGPVETSIVERNARVIKWLFNCRKVQSLCGIAENVATKKQEA